MENILTCAVGRGLNRAGGPIRQHPALHMPPQMIHGVEFRGGFGQKAQFKTEGLGQLQAIFGRVRRPPVFKQHDLPPAPMRPNHRQKVLMGFLHPLVGDQQQHCAAPDIDRSMEHPFAAIARDGDLDLLAHPPIATVQGRGFAHNRFIQHQTHRAVTLAEPPLEPPLACRHVGDRSAK